MSHVDPTLTPDTITWVGFGLVVVVIVALSKALPWLHDRMTRTQGTSGAVTTRRYTERPESDGGWPWHCVCGVPVLYDYDADAPELCAPCKGRIADEVERELGGAA